MRTWYVYLYPYPQGMIIDGVDVSGIVFYVGKGTGGRFDVHEREAEKACPCRKCCEIRRCWDAGYVIQKQIVFQTAKQQDALEKERELIHQHQGPYLTNVAHNQEKVARPRQKQYFMDIYTDGRETIRVDVTDFIPKGTKFRDLSTNDLNEISSRAEIKAGYEKKTKVPKVRFIHRDIPFRAKQERN